MKIQEAVPLSVLATFRVGGLARYVIECENVEELKDALRFAKERALPWRILGEGSNILPADAGFDGVIIRLAMHGIEMQEEQDGTLLVADAGVSWDRLVEAATGKGLW